MLLGNLLMVMMPVLPGWNESRSLLLMMLLHYAMGALPPFLWRRRDEFSNAFSLRETGETDTNYF